MIDLHTHSTASDGTCAPAELIAMAQASGLSAIALTDHDTVNGLPEFLDAARPARVQAVPGVEIGCSWYGGSLHIVGLFVDHTDPRLGRLLSEVRTARDRRNRQIVAALGNLGLALEWDEIAAPARGGVIGRPHIARALVARGYCRSMRDAFTRFLGRDRPGYVRRHLPLPSETIAVIHGAGGVAVWAHPLAIRARTPAKIRQVARHLRRSGLDGIEIYYPDHSPAQTRTARRIAAELGLLGSGGSDFHGANFPDIALGSGRGTLAVPDTYLPPLAARARTHFEAHRQCPN